MKTSSLLLLVALVAIAIATVSAHKSRRGGGSRRSGSRRRGGSWSWGRRRRGHSVWERDSTSWDLGYEKACQVIIDSEIILERNCSCETTTSDSESDGSGGISECTLQAPVRDYNGLQEQRTFCYTQPDDVHAVSGKLEKACMIVDDVGRIIVNNTASCADEDGGPCPYEDSTQAWTGFTVGGTQAQAYFCPKPAPTIRTSCSWYSCGACRVQLGEETDECTCPRGNCTLTAPGRLNDDGVMVQRTYCYVEPDEGSLDFKGELEDVCLIESTVEGAFDPLSFDCDADKTCRLGPNNAWSLTYRGQEARAYVCTRECVEEKKVTPRHLFRWLWSLFG